MTKCSELATTSAGAVSSGSVVTDTTTCSHVLCSDKQWPGDAPLALLGTYRCELPVM
jgi:hypothetical protein